MWLVYWIIIACTSWLHDLVYDILPFANEIRLLWVLYLYHPMTRGGLVLLEQGVRLRFGF